MDEGRLVEVALDAARAAAEVHRRQLGRVGTDAWQTKATADFVTDVDREAEAAILARVRDAFPDHAVLAEESADDGERPDLAGADWVWIIDPLDGTTNWLHAYPMYAASIAVARRGQLVAGVVVNGATGQAWTAARGAGAYLDGAPTRVSARAALPQALIGTGFPFRTPHEIPAYLHQLGRVMAATAGVRRAGAAALDLCHVASGWLDGFWELSLAPWDIAAGTLIIREAAGVVTRLDGSPDMLGAGSVLAGNPGLHPRLGQLVAEGTSSAPGHTTGSMTAEHSGGESPT
ncbi:MAG: inositol monophosphatase family protein [Gemmatimonadota bacterium]